MQLVEWNSIMDMGIPELDEQHRGLVSMLNQLHEACFKGDREEATRKTLREMMHYAAEHFKFEESLMVQASYSGLDGHRSEHEEFIDRVQQFEHKVYQDRCDSGEVLVYLSGWLTDHILASDRAFARFMGTTQG